MSEAVGQNQDPYQKPRGEVIAERNTVVPPWAPKIHDFSIRVKVQDGDQVREIPPGFTIGEVAPEHRWAIDPDTGIVMDPPTFRENYGRWYANQYTMINQQVEGEPLSVPDVISFVSRQIHPDDPSKLAPMDYDGNRPIASPVKPVHDSQGEKLSPERLAELEGSKKADKAGSQMEMLVKIHNDGMLTDAQFSEQSKQVFGGSVVVGEDGADSADPVAVEPPPGFEQKEAPTDPDPAPPADEPPEMVATLCGKEVKVRGKHVHERQCQECKHIRELGETLEDRPGVPPKEE
jgi:hypothetical protein